jgi:site-specific DNA-methyltransferase (adenine-specific)
MIGVGVVSNIKLIHGECLEHLRRFKSDFVDLTVTSPPYDKLRTYKNTCDWSFGLFQDIAKELYRVTKPGGVVVWVVGDATVKGSETGSSFRQALYFKELGFNLHDTMIYQSRKPPLTHNRYEQEFEYMFVLSKGKPKTVNHIKVPSTYAGQKRTATLRQDSDELSDRSAKGVKADTKIKGNIWYFDTGGGKSSKDKIAFKHPAIFPEQLAHDHIVSWSNPGDTVLDPFIGSGTTGKMAKQLGRHFIGIERVEEYIAIAKERIGYE